MADTPDGVRKGGSYLSYQLRLWREDDESNLWRASLESAGILDRIGFSCLDALFEYIRQKTTGQGSAAGAADGKEVTNVGGTHANVLAGRR
jgi:hypothetical protein